MRVLSYDASWRLVDEQVDDGWSPSPGTFTVDRTLEQFWGLRYIDDPILRRDDPAAVGGYWHITDTQFSTAALLDNNADVYERVWYTPYGEARHHWGKDYNGDRIFNSADGSALSAAISGGSVPINDGAYVVEMDYNRDGVLDSSDTPSGSDQLAVTLGQIGDLDATSGPDNWIGYAGYVWEGASSLYHVRNRSYNPSLGRWKQRDPLEYAESANMLLYASGDPVLRVDFGGMESIPIGAQQKTQSADPRDDLYQGCGIRVHRRPFGTYAWNDPGHGWIEISDPQYDNPNGTPNKEGLGYYPLNQGNWDGRGKKYGGPHSQSQSNADCVCSNQNDPALGTGFDDGGVGVGYETVPVYGEPGRQHLDWARPPVIAWKRVPHISAETTCDQVRDCVRNAMPTDDYHVWGFWGDNCHDFVNSTLAKCGLKKGNGWQPGDPKNYQKVKPKPRGHM